MVREDDYKKLSEKFLIAAEKSFHGKDEVEFTVYSGFNVEENEWFVAVEIDNDEMNTFMFKPDQAKKFIPNLAFSIQFSFDDNFQSFARMIIRNFSEAIKAIEGASDGDIVGIVIRRRKQ
jgi:hypothetical protein